MKVLFKSKKMVFLSIVALLVVALAIWCAVDVCTGIQSINNYASQPKPGQSEPVRQAISDYSDRMAELELPEGGDIACPDYTSWYNQIFHSNVMYAGNTIGDLAFQTAYANMAVQGRILGWFSGEQDSTQFILLVTKNIVGRRGVLRTLRVAVPQGSNCAEILKNTGEVVLFLDVIDKERSLTRLHLHEHSIFEVKFLGQAYSYSNLASNRYYNGTPANKLVKTVKELARAMEIE